MFHLSHVCGSDVKDFGVNVDVVVRIVIQVVDKSQLGLFVLLP